MDQLKEIAQMTKDLVGKDYLYFDKEVEIKMTPHSSPVNIWAIAASPANDVYVMDNNEKWHKLEQTDQSLVGSLYQRLKIMSTQYSKAS